MSRSSLRWLFGILAVVVLVGGAAAFVIWSKVASLKDSLVSNLGTALGAHVEITSLDLDWWHREIHAAGVSLTNERPDAPWEKGEISQATIRFHWHDLLASTLPVRIEVSSWNIVLRATVTDSTTAPPPLPGQVQVTHLSAQQGEVVIHLANNKEVDVQGVAFQADNNGAAVWTTDLQASSVVAGSLQAGASSVQIRGETGKISFSNLRMQCDQGFLTGEGEVALTAPHAAQFALKASDIPVSMLVSVDWQMKLSGLASGDLTYTGDDQSASATGQLAINHAKFNVLPWLGKVTALVGLADISDVEVDKATSDFEWKDQSLHLSNLDIRKNDVTRIAGDVLVDATGQVDGKLKLGLPSAVMAKWPDLQTKVFSDAHDDFDWTDVHLTGSSDHLQEDLTPRLLAAGAQEGTGILNQVTQKAQDLYKSFMGN